MNFFSDLYLKSLAENAKNTRFWEDYLHSLDNLDLHIFADKLRVPTLVPIGSRILFRGEFKHTNEVTVGLGADYFTKCSLKQAEELRQHRIKGANYKLELLKKEKEYLESQYSLKNQNISNDSGKEIIEFCSEEDDKAWREKHRENVRRYKQQESNKKEPQNDVNYEEPWNKLDELELQEELENEYLDNKTQEISQVDIKLIGKHEDKNVIHKDDNNDKVTLYNPSKNTSEVSQFDLLQNVIDKQNELEQKLQDIRNKEKVQTKTEEDLLLRLEEIEKLEELEDDIDRIDDMLKLEKEPETSTLSTNKRAVSFADEDDSDTLEINFTHSTVLPSPEGYDPDRGILKPSDIYEAHVNLLPKTKSILKTSKYMTDIQSEPSQNITPKAHNYVIEENTQNITNRTILIKDVVEKTNPDNKNNESIKTRPVSLFKKMRQQK